jgi:hypothetical protein
MRRNGVLVEGDGMSEVQGFLQNIDISLLGFTPGGLFRVLNP